MTRDIAAQYLRTTYPNTKGFKKLHIISLKVIEVKMKRQLHAPAYISPKKPEDILRSLVWLQGLEDEAVNYITSNAELLSYDYGDTIVKQGEVCDGIYLIISGMVKVSNG